MTARELQTCTFQGFGASKTTKIQRDEAGVHEILGGPAEGIPGDGCPGGVLGEGGPGGGGGGGLKPNTLWV